MPIQGTVVAVIEENKGIFISSFFEKLYYSKWVQASCPSCPQPMSLLNVWLIYMCIYCICIFFPQKYESWRTFFRHLSEVMLLVKLWKNWRSLGWNPHVWSTHASERRSLTHKNLKLKNLVFIFLVHITDLSFLLASTTHLTGIWKFKCWPQWLPCLHLCEIIALLLFERLSVQICNLQYSS